MHIVMKCKNCKRAISWPVEKPFDLERCPVCEEYLSSDANWIDDIAVKVNNGVSRLSYVTIEGIYAGDEDTRIRREHSQSVFLDDLNSLAAMYQDASAEVKEYLSKIVDTMYLLVDQDAKDENGENLKQTHMQVRELWKKKFGIK